MPATDVFNTASKPNTPPKPAAKENPAPAKTEEPKVRSQESTDGEPRFFEGTVAKMRKNEDGEWEEVMSDNLYPGEKLKSEWDLERSQEAADKAAKAAKN